MRLLYYFFILFFFTVFLFGKAAFSSEGRVCDITLIECVASALNHNYALKQAQERLIQAETEYYDSINDKLRMKLSGAAYIAKNPSAFSEGFFNSGGTLEYISPDGSSFSLDAEMLHSSSSSSNYDLGVSYRRPLARGGGVVTPWQDVRSSERNWAGERYQFFLERQSLVYSLIQSYLRLIYAQRRIEVNKLFVKSSLDNLTVTKRKFEEGLVPKIDLSRAEVNLLNSKASLLNAETSWEEQRDALLLEIGLDPRLAVRPVYDLSYSPAVFNEDECIAAALSLRKEPKMDEIDLEGLKDDLTVAKNNFKPQIDFVASWNKTLFNDPARDSGLVSSRRTNSWSAGIEYTAEIGQRRKKSDIDRANRNLILGSEKLEQTKREIIKEVRDAIRDLKLAENQVIIKEESLVAAEERLRLATRSWEEGIVNNREMLDAQEDLTDARISLIGARIDYVIYAYALKKAMGIDLLKSLLEEPGNTVDKLSEDTL